MDSPLVGSRELKAEYLRTQITALRRLGQSLPAAQRVLLTRAIEQLEETIEEAQTGEDELRRLVSELEAAHEVVEAERRRYHDLFEFAPHGYIVTDPDGAIREANRAAAELLNVPPQELRHTPLVTYVEARYRRAFRQQMSRLRREDRLAAWDLELRPRGRPVIDAALSVATIHARDDRVVGLRWIVQNITERRRMQDTLRFLAEASSQLASSLDYETTLPAIARLTLPWLADWCAIFTAEEQGDLHDVAIAATDPTREEALRQIAAGLVRSAIPPDLPLRETLLQGQTRVLTEGIDHLAAALLETEDLAPALDAFAPRCAVVAPLLARGQALGALVLGRTESDRSFEAGDVGLAEDLARRIALAIDNARLVRLAQEAQAAAERRERQLADFVRMMAHDVQQPLTAIHWHSQIMRRTLDNGNLDAIRSSQETIEIATERLDAMIRDLVESARLDVGQLHLEREPIELADFLSRVTRRLVVGPDAGRVRLGVEAAPPVLGDPRRLERVFGNLISNALKYSDAASEVTIRIAPANGEVVVSVTDRGIGIAPEALPRLFERGFRAAGATTKAEGLGLGLYITSQLVTAHGGRLWVESKLGKGSTFFVALPIAPSEE